ncbi:MAG: DUF3102 domain-containing protein, partial [Kiritimatiellae bacterium]|nr:DUF3102 domain-containing protein [Kiritimatiellia bacterium]
MKKNKNSVVVAEPVVVEPLPVFEQCSSNDAAERVRFHLDEAKKHGRSAIAHIIEAGRELALQKQLLGYGQWKNWCEGNLNVSLDTADRYIATFQKTIGVQRAQQQIPLEKKILKKELEAATVGMEEKTVRQAMIEIGVIKQHSAWGGKRDGAGRKAKDAAADEAAALDEIKDTPAVLWGLCRDPLHKLNDLERERHFIDRLEFVELSEVYSI